MRWAKGTDMNDVKPDGGHKHSSLSREAKVLIIVCASLILLIGAGVIFGLGYYMGNQGAKVNRIAGGQQGQASLGGQGQQGAGMRQRLRQMISSGEASLVNGTVASVEGGKLAVDSARGSQTVKITDSTRFIGTGASGQGLSDLKKGEKVLVLARKATGGGDPEAVAVRIGGAARLQQQSSAPSQQL
jgi:hypothetical protein